MLNTQAIKQYRAKRLAQIKDFQYGQEEDLRAEDRPRRVAKALSNYPFFCETYFAHLLTAEGKMIPNAPFHTAAARYIRHHPNATALFEWPRAHAKSTHMSVLIPLWLKIQRGFKVMVVVAKSQEMAMRLLGDLQLELAYNDRYIADFGVQVKQGEWEDNHFVTQDNTAFFALGRGQSPRGLKYAGNRPDYIVVDDLDDDELVRNPARVQQVIEWLFTAVYNTMTGGRGRFIIVGNRIGKHSVIAQVAENPSFYHSQINALDGQGHPSWPAHYSAEQFEHIRTTIGELAWQKEYMNNPITQGSIFPPLQWTKPLPLRQYTYLLAYTDPSFRHSDKSDYKATVLVGKTRDGYYHILKAYVRRASVTDMVQWHYTLYEEITAAGAPVSFYMEANYIQDILLDAFREAGKQRGHHLPIQGDKRSKPDKFQRIANLQPYISNGIIRLNETEKHNADMRLLEEQFLLFEKGSRIHDDAPDATEGAIFLLNAQTQQDQPIHRIPRSQHQHKFRY